MRKRGKLEFVNDKGTIPLKLSGRKLTKEESEKIREKARASGVEARPPSG